MVKEFINTTVFDKRWGELNLTDEDLRTLQNQIMGNPYIGDIIEGTGGAIKIRYALSGRGKSGGLSV